MEKDLLLCPITREGYIEERYKSGEIYHMGGGLRLPLEGSSEVPPEMRFEGWLLIGRGSHPLPRLRFQGLGCPH